MILLAAVTVQRTLGSGSVAGARPATAIECRSAALGLGEKDRVETIAVLDGYRTLREAPGGDLLRAPWHATWEVQCSGPGGRYLGSLKWDADTGYLMGVSGIPAPHRVGGPEDARSGPLTGARSADAAAAAWLAALPPAGIVWRAASPPRRIGDYWECRLRADAGRGALLRLDIETGDLRQAIFSGPALPDWAAAARR